MGWPYQFLNLDEAEKHARRLALDRYASYAQLSSLLPIAVVLVYRFGRWAAKAAAARRGPYDAIPSSPALKFERDTASGWRVQVNKLRWWLGGEVQVLGHSYGQRDQWVFGGLWTTWLLFLCVAETGQDYLHFTKRLGIVAASQFPLQYLLSLKSLNPFVPIFRSSHEQVNRWHRPVGRIVYFLLCLHAAFYLNYFVGVGILVRRLTTPLVLAGVLSFFCMSILIFTALPSIRRFSYRLFFLTHLVTVVAMPPLLFFHAHSGRTFMVVTLVVFALDLITRKLDTVTSLATLETIPGTNLVKIVMSLPYHKINRFRTHPGAHVYLSIPAAARADANPASATFLLFEFLFNPFTVAAVDDENGDLTLVARHQGGPITSALARFARIKPAAATVSSDEGKIPLCIEGPYGQVRHFPNLAGGDFDRILLVAGGIGATFTVPLYRAVVHDNPHVSLKMVWAVRSAGEATWALTGGTGKGKSILDDENVHIFLTGDVLEPGNTGGAAAKARVATRSRTAAAAAAAANGDGGGSSSASGDGADGEVEMSAMYRDRRRGGRYTAGHNRKRPDLRKFVDDTFGHGAGERVAVVMCGPEEMARELREYVGVWVTKGRSVFWHNEGFGW